MYQQQLASWILSRNQLLLSFEVRANNMFQTQIQGFTQKSCKKDGKYIIGFAFTKVSFAKFSSTE